MINYLYVCQCAAYFCIALPFLVLLIPSVASFWINDESVHIVLVMLAVPISLFAMGISLRKHHNYKCIALAGLGLALLVLAIFMHDIGFGGEHVNLEHGSDEHGNEKHSDGIMVTRNTVVLLKLSKPYLQY